MTNAEEKKIEKKYIVSSLKKWPNSKVEEKHPKNWDHALKLMIL